MRALAVLAVVSALLTAPRAAHAHQSSLTHSQVTVEGAEVHYRILIAPEDLAEAEGQPVPYVTSRIEVLDGETPCPVEAGAAGTEGAFVKITWIARCPAPVTMLVIEYDLFFDLDDAHEAVLRVLAGGDKADTVLKEGASRFVWELAEPPPSGTLAFVRSGVDHILFGFDHIAFVLTLLLALVIARELGHNGWRRRRLGESLRATALIVTSFTVAHSITLIAASLGYVSIPDQVVEAAIALSIAYTAIENIVRPDVRWRSALTFAFGLLHGLGFARMLEVQLPPDDVIVPLLAFNVGVELGQLAIVALSLPLLWLLAGRIGGERYRRQVLPALSVVLAILGVLWLIERVFEVTILGF
jgi:hypothetical protein